MLCVTPVSFAQLEAEWLAVAHVPGRIQTDHLFTLTPPKKEEGCSEGIYDPFSFSFHHEVSL